MTIRKNHKNALERMFDVNVDEVLSDEVVALVEAAEANLAKLGRAREFAFEWFAILLAQIRADGIPLKVKKAEKAAETVPQG